MHVVKGQTGEENVRVSFIPCHMYHHEYMHMCYWVRGRYTRFSMLEGRGEASHSSGATLLLCQSSQCHASSVLRLPPTSSPQPSCAPSEPAQSQLFSKSACSSAAKGRCSKTTTRALMIERGLLGVCGASAAAPILCRGITACRTVAALPAPHRARFARAGAPLAALGTQGG